MNKTQERNMVRDYGITNPGPVLARYRKFDRQFNKTVKRVTAELQARIEADERLARASKILRKK